MLSGYGCVSRAGSPEGAPGASTSMSGRTRPAASEGDVEEKRGDEVEDDRRSSSRKISPAPRTVLMAGGHLDRCRGGQAVSDA